VVDQVGIRLCYLVLGLDARQSGDVGVPKTEGTECLLRTDSRRKEKSVCITLDKALHNLSNPIALQLLETDLSRQRGNVDVDGEQESGCSEL